jgi:SAM-dependent methyltransferase
MKYVGSLIKKQRENWPEYFSRLRFAVLRRVHPKYKEQYRLESLVGPENCWEELIQYQFNLLTGIGVKPEHSLLDIGCGALTTGLKLIPFLDRGNYVGVDLRTEPLNEAYRLISKHGLVGKNPTLINSSTLGKEELTGRKFDWIWMSQLSYHFDDGLISKLFEQAARALLPSGSLVFDIMDPKRILPGSSQWNGFRFHVRPLEKFGELGSRSGFSMEDLGQIAQFGYPKRIDLHTNTLLRFRKRNELSDRQAMSGSQRGSVGK